MIFFTSILVVGGIFALVTYQKNQKKLAEVSALSVQETASEQTFSNLANKDSDTDGLKDWEEALWHTDPHNSDTDGDGTSDGEEVKQNRNPIVAGPNDSLIDHPVKSSAMANAVDPNLTETDKFARDVFSKYMAMKQQGVPLSADAQAGLVKNMLQNQSLELDSKKYSKKDFMLSDDGDIAIKQYGNEMAHILTTYSVTSRDPSLIARDSIVHNNPDEIKTLDPVIKSYNNILKYSLLVKVPPSAVNVQIALLNSLSDMSVIIKNMRSMNIDPLVSLKGFSHYGESLPVFVQTLVDLKNYLLQRKIVFLPNEEGYIFGHPIPKQ